MVPVGLNIPYMTLSWHLISINWQCVPEYRIRNWRKALIALCDYSPRELSPSGRCLEFSVVTDKQHQLKSPLGATRGIASRSIVFNIHWTWEPKTDIVTLGNITTYTTLMRGLNNLQLYSNSIYSKNNGLFHQNNGQIYWIQIAYCWLEVNTWELHIQQAAVACRCLVMPPFFIWT